MKNVFKALYPLWDLLLAPLLFPAAILMRMMRRAGAHRLPISRRVLSMVGVFPIADHYHEPLINFSRLTRPLNEPRNLPGIDLNLSEQFELLKTFVYSEELRPFNGPKRDDLTYSFSNTMFTCGDAEFLYNLIRAKKPKRVIEIGSGNSTLLVIEALRQNRAQQPGYNCEHTCIEPYENPWLDRAGVRVRRQVVEAVDQSVFLELEAGDLLFIDSSHVIRPQGDVLYEFLEILPILKKGVIVHIHDIFTPRDYPESWVIGKVHLWNEQYLMEALLSGNPHWKVVGAVNHLFHEHFEQLKKACPFLDRNREPGSFYVEKVM